MLTPLWLVHDSRTPIKLGSSNVHRRTFFCRDYPKNTLAGLRGVNVFQIYVSNIARDHGSHRSIPTSCRMFTSTTTSSLLVNDKIKWMITHTIVHVCLLEGALFSLPIAASIFHNPVSRISPYYLNNWDEYTYCLSYLEDPDMRSQ